MLRKFYLRAAAKYGVIALLALFGLVVAAPLLFCLLSILLIPTG